MRSFWMAVVGAAALAGCSSSGQSTRPANPQPPPSMTHQAQPVGEAPVTQGEMHTGPGVTARTESAPPQITAGAGTTSAMPQSPSGQPAATTAQRGGMNMEAMCPMTVPGTKVKAENTSNGAALVFTTSKANVAQVQQRVKAMAQMHNQHPEHMGTGGAGHGAPPMRPPPAGMHAALMHAQARGEDLPNGARLVFTPKEASQQTQLRNEVKAHAEKMSSGQCGMGGMHGAHGVSRPPPAPGAHPAPHP